MKPFRKRYKDLMVNGFEFHCVIDEHFKNEFVVFRAYPHNTKTSFFEICFSWSESWHFNPMLPSTCTTLIKYAINNGWAYNREKQQLRIEQGDFLRKLIELPD
ncbi:MULTISPECIES: hypothetical protein [unclassified Paenibacillus]|uniref:hypothetical protein n=1 Tax=unclassified Paenibacillus TaxID=185978 RepID=UPI000562D851|nr:MULTISPECIES: hypothetical protein [unclassified Paenibacillus]